MGLAVQYHVLSHRFRRGAELDGFCGNEIEETDGSCRELRGGRGDSGRRRCQTRGASRHAGGSGDGPARAGGPRRAGVAGLRERSRQRWQTAPAGPRNPRGRLREEGLGPPGGRATGVRGLGESQPTASRSPSDASFSCFVVSFVCFMLFNTCYFWTLRTAHTALSLPIPVPVLGDMQASRKTPRALLPRGRAGRAAWTASPVGTGSGGRGGAGLPCP